MQGDALDDILDRLEVLRGRERVVSELTGGLTNRNYKVVTGAGSYVVRLSSPDTDLLAIDRDREYRNSLAAASAGVGAPVVGYLPGEGVLVVEFIAGRTLTDADLAVDGILARVAQSCRRLHAGPRFAGDFDMIAVQRRYRDLVAERGFDIPAGYDDYADEVVRVQQALAVWAEATVPCNNDLLAANLIDDGSQIWIIDYEYAGNNDACFELGNLAAEVRLPIAALEELVTAYYGQPRPGKVARARLFGLLAHYGWTLWASIQAATSAIDFDFPGWGLEKYETAREQFADPDFERLLEEVAHRG